MNWQISREVNKEDLAWMSGIWDGEGCIRAAFNKSAINDNPTLKIEAFVKNTDVFMIRKLSQILYDLGIKFCFVLSKEHTDNYDTHHKEIICIKISGKGNVWKLLTVMFPYLITKKHQASLAIELIEYRESLGYHGIAKCIVSIRPKCSCGGNCRSMGKYWKCNVCGKCSLKTTDEIITASKKQNWNGLLITDDAKVVELVNRIQRCKSELVNPSETKRVANRPLEIPDKLINAYLMI